MLGDQRDGGRSGDGHVAQGDVLNRGFRAPVQADRLWGADAEVAEGHAADIAQPDGFLDIDPERDAAGVDSEVIEHQVGEVQEAGVASAQVADRVVDVDAVASAVDDDVAEGRVADGVVARAANADALAAAVEDAVGDGHVFAERTVVWPAAVARKSAVIDSGDVAVADGHAPTVVNVNAVVVFILLAAVERMREI